VAKKATTLTRYEYFMVMKGCGFELCLWFLIVLSFCVCRWRIFGSLSNIKRSIIFVQLNALTIYVFDLKCLFQPNLRLTISFYKLCLRNFVFWVHVSTRRTSLSCVGCLEGVRNQSNYVALVGESRPMKGLYVNRRRGMYLHAIAWTILGLSTIRRTAAALRCTV